MLFLIWTALGPDGYSMLFYQECWDTINGDLMIVFREFYGRGQLNMSRKSTFIVLIPKEGARELGDYKPISLLSTEQSL